MIGSRKMESLRSAVFTRLENIKKELLAQGKEVFNFSIGTPDLPPAPHIIKALQQAAGDAENYKYAIVDKPELMDAVRAWYQKRYQVELSHHEITSVMGSQEGLAHISLALVNPGDTVLVPDPGYPIFSVGPALASANIVKMPLEAEKGYLVDLDAIPASVAHEAKLMVVSYPNNPVTAIAPLAFYEKLVWFAKKYSIIVIHDNAYSELVFDGQTGSSFLSVPGAKDVGIEFNSLSKSYNMTGCRIAFALGNPDIVGQLKVLKSHTDYGVFLPVQMAAIAALTGSQDNIVKTRQAYENRRNVLVDGLGRLGWHIPKPPATMFVWAPAPNGCGSSEAFTMKLLHETGVMVVPGSSFGERGEGYVRFALVQPESQIQKALEVIQNASSQLFS